jgi:hypothetical protein
MKKTFLTFESDGEPIAKVVGGDLAGEILHVSQTEHKQKKRHLSLPKGVKLPPRKASEVLLFLNDAYAKGIPPEHLNAPPPLKDLYERMYKSAESSTEIILPPNSTFSLLPSSDEKTRDVYYICGPSGSGKSYVAKTIAQEYHENFPDRPILLISKLLEDNTLDKLKFLQRVDPAKLVGSPITDLNVVSDSLIIFDDIENFDKETDKVLQNLINSIASTGRHANVSMVYITHLLSDYKRTRLLLQEATRFVLYPQSTGGHAFNYLLQHYLGMDKDEIAALRKSGSRWVCISRQYPSWVVTEHSARIMNA